MNSDAQFAQFPRAHVASSAGPEENDMFQVRAPFSDTRRQCGVIYDGDRCIDQELGQINRRTSGF
jgi:hypothetical protein